MFCVAKTVKRPATLAFIAALLFSCCTTQGVQQALTSSDNAANSIAAPASNYWPRVNEFSAGVEDIKPGENVTLRWDVSNAKTVAIDGGVGKVPPAGSVQVSPGKTTRYKLTASGEKGISTAWVTVSVAEKITLMPDLVITGITYNSGLLYYTIKNVGGADAGPCDTYLFDQSNMWRDTSWVDGLKSGEEKTQPFTNFNYDGNKITVCADGGKVIPEANEDNNCLVPTFGYKYRYDFQQYASRAVWRGSAGRPVFGLAGDDGMGIVRKLSLVTAEDGAEYRNVIEMVPARESYAWLEGVFGDWQEQWQAGGYMLPMSLPNNARFTARVGLSRESEASEGVTFQFGIMEGGGISWWPGVKAEYDGVLQSMDIDLSAYAGKKVMAVLRVESGAGIEGNHALWISPEINQ